MTNFSPFQPIGAESQQPEWKKYDQKNKRKEKLEFKSPDVLIANLDQNTQIIFSGMIWSL
jgi:hypothetical protein